MRDLGLDQEGEAVSTASKARYRDALRSADLRKLATAFVIDALGGWAQSVVLAVYIYDRTGSPTWLGAPRAGRGISWLAALGAARWIPGLLLGSVGGVIADRYDRAKVMVYSALASFVVTCAIAV